MSDRSVRALRPIRFGLVLLVLPLTFGWLAAQDTKPKKPPVEEEEDPKGGKPLKKPPVEEPDTKKPPLKKPIDIDEDPKNPPKSPGTPVKPPTPPAPPVVEVDLAKERVGTTHPELQKLYNDLTHPFDRLQHRDEGWLNVVPIPTHIGNATNASAIKYTVFAAPGVPGKFTVSAGPGQILSSEPFEQVAVKRVKDLLTRGLERQPNSLEFLARLDQLVAADKVLTFATRFSEKADRKGAGWDAVRKELNDYWLDVLTEELAVLNSAGASDKDAAKKAGDLAARIGATFPNSVRAQKELWLWKLGQGGDARTVNETFEAAYDALKKMERTFPRDQTGDNLRPLRERLQRKGSELLGEAKGLAANDDTKPDALYRLEVAMKVWPDTPGLVEYHRDMTRSFRLLNIGVRVLPDRMSPAAAVTDSDRWAVELLFESLVQPVADDSVGQVYRPVLAERAPRIIPLGREFKITHGALWMSKDGPGREVTASDVRDTVNALKESRFLPCAEGVELLGQPQLEDPFRLPLRLERGYIDPLALMTFKVLPVQQMREHNQGLLDETFAKSPVGSGPFVYAGRRTEEGRELSVFRANPKYGQRPGKFGQPRIQEIRFVQRPADASEEIAKGKLDLLLDVPTAEMIKLREGQEISRLVSDVTLPSRRIWMLAVNHRKPELSGAAGKPLRRALAHAIDRDKILDQVFRAGVRQYHQPLAGPFPPRSWANPPGAVGLFREEYARTNANQVRSKPKLTLKHLNDPQIAEACKRIKEQVEQLGLLIEIEPVPLSADELRKAVEQDHDFDLAYYPFDYTSDLFWLGGLLDPEARDRNGRNFLGYEPDATVTQLLRQIRNKRDFTEVKKATHLLHAAMVEQMPFVPLWHLDTHLILSKKLQTVPTPSQIDPLTVFGQIEEWRLDR